MSDRMNDATSDPIKARVRDHYAQAAQRVLQGSGGCCGDSAAARCCDPITAGLYGDADAAQVPAVALAASLGCGNPVALAALAPGEVVLDLGSGGGIDVLLAARRVGPTGHAYGLDMTDAMLDLARANAAGSGLPNVSFLKGDIEAIPLPDASVDVVVSNCVINLAADKDRVLAEAFRVLKPGGRFAVADVLSREEVPAALREDLALWAGCVAGALSIAEYQAKLARAGFTGIGIEVTRTFDAQDAEAFRSAAPRADAGALAGRFVSAFVRAAKPS